MSRRHLCLMTLIHKGYFSIEMLNRKLKTFKFKGHDQINKPQVVNLRNESKTIGGNAHENWLLLRMLLLLVGSAFLVPAYPGCPGKKAVKRM